MIEICLKIDNKGVIHTLYRDRAFYLKIRGILKVFRASEVRFVNGLWNIFKYTPAGLRKIGHRHKNRDSAIKEEIRILNGELLK